MNARISVLIPSHHAPRHLALTIANLSSKAYCPKTVEYIAVVDYDDPGLQEYKDIADSFTGLGLLVACLVSPVTGYSALPAMFEQAYQASTGNLIWFFNDDGHVETASWDEVYWHGLKNIPFGVADAVCSEGIVRPGEAPSHYPWAFPMIRRDICAAIGNKACIGTGVISNDRIYDAYARKTGHVFHSPVVITHERSMLIPGSEREKTYSAHEANWPAALARWDSDAQKIQDAVHDAENSAIKIVWPIF